jgi:K+-sensing histidine kinase KdpD
MHTPAHSQPRRTSGEPWFQQRPHLTLAVIAALFVTVFALRMLTGTPADAYSMLYVLPVALAATAFGQRGGAAASVVAVGLIVIWTLLRDVHLAPTGWATRLVPILLLGLALGRATDRARRAETERRHLERAAVLHREAIEINDSLIQQMTAAKWAFEAGQTDAGLDALTAAVHDAQQLVSGLIRRADMAERSEPVTAPAGRHASVS